MSSSAFSSEEYTPVFAFLGALARARLLPGVCLPAEPFTFRADSHHTQNAPGQTVSMWGGDRRAASSELCEQGGFFGGLWGGLGVLWNLGELATAFRKKAGDVNKH